MYKCYDVISPHEIMCIINSCNICRLCVSENDIPYVIPMYYNSFLEDNHYIFNLTSSVYSKKISILNNNENVCIEIERNYKNATETVILYGYVFNIRNLNNICIIEIKVTEQTARRYYL